MKARVLLRDEAITEREERGISVFLLSVHAPTSSMLLHSCIAFSEHLYVHDIVLLHSQLARI